MPEIKRFKFLWKAGLLETLAGHVSLLQPLEGSTLLGSSLI